MWDVFIRRWLELVFWWLPKNQGARSKEAENAPPQRPQAPRAAEPSARPASAPQAGRDAPSPAGAGTRPAAKPTAAPAPPSNGGAPRPPAAGVRAPAKPTVTQPEKALTPPIPDDLTVIKGIGPAVQNKLRALGIITFADLAAADPDRLLAEFKGSQPLTAARVRGWTEAARERARA